MSSTKGRGWAPSGPRWRSDKSNEPARLLYERFGFSVAGVRRAYYTKPVEDAIVLWREGLDTRSSG